jgi:hypothetical protein
MPNPFLSPTIGNVSEPLQPGTTKTDLIFDIQRYQYSYFAIFLLHGFAQTLNGLCPNTRTA